MRRKRAMDILTGFTVIAAIVFMGCGNHSASTATIPNTESTYEQNCQPTDETTAPDSDPNNENLNILVNAQYYLITEQNGLFSYEIYDKNQDIVRTEQNLIKQPAISMTSDSIISVTGQAGTGIATSFTYYYNAETNQFSPIYSCVLTQYENLVVYTTADTVMIQDIFDDRGYYQEITAFEKPFSPVAYPFVKAEFTNNASSLCVTYLSGAEYEEVYETFDIHAAEQ